MEIGLLLDVDWIVQGVGHRITVSKGRASRHSGIDDPMPFQPDGKIVV